MTGGGEGGGGPVLTSERLFFARDEKRLQLERQTFI